MRILYITQYFTTPEQPGSLRHYAHTREWARRGHEVTVITSQVVPKLQSIPDRRGGKRTKEEFIDEVHVLKVRSLTTLRGFVGRMGNYLSFMFRAIVVGRRIDGSFDVVVASSPPLFAAVAGAILARRLRAFFVMDVRDLWPRSAVVTGFLRNRALIWLARKLELWLYRKASHITCATEGIAGTINSMGHRTKASVIRNGIDVDLFGPIADRTDSEDLDGIEIAYAGAHGTNNALEVIIDAAARLRSEPVVFKLIGHGPCTSLLVARARELQLDNVEFLGSLPRSEVPRRLAQSDALIWPVLSRSDNPELMELKRGAVPNKLYDYLALGRPVITSVPTDSEAEDLIRSFGQGYFVEHSGDGFAKAIRELLREGATESLQTKALKFREAYSRERQAIAFLGVLEEIVERSQGKSG